MKRSYKHTGEFRGLYGLRNGLLPVGNVKGYKYAKVCLEALKRAFPENEFYLDRITK